MIEISEQNRYFDGTGIQSQIQIQNKKQKNRNPKSELNNDSGGQNGFCVNIPLSFQGRSGIAGPHTRPSPPLCPSTSAALTRGHCAQSATAHRRPFPNLSPLVCTLGPNPNDPSLPRFPRLFFFLLRVAIFLSRLHTRDLFFEKKSHVVFFFAF